MQPYHCMIVEDEPLAAEVLQDYIKQIPFLQLKATCPDAIYALDLLQKDRFDLIFLDIHMPRLKGFDFIKTVQHPPAIIITSAYQEYALQAYEYNVLDYLLKPFEFNRFLMAVNKLSAQIAKPDNEYWFFNVNKKKVRIFLNDILYIESLKEYIRIVTRDRTVITKFQLGQMEALLAQDNFMRIHRSFIVAKDKIDAFTATDVEIQTQLIPIGRGYRHTVQMELASHDADN